MARNKHPENTVNKILDVSLKLFNEQGYEKTTIQDIVNNLGGLSKGAVYHHFKSKEEIFEAVTDRTFDEGANVELILKNDQLNGFEKLQMILKNNISDETSKVFLTNLKVYLQNPEFLVKHLKSSIYENAPYITMIINEGIEDGSLATDFPQELAEVVSLLFNIYANPAIFYLNKEELQRRLLFIKFILDNMGIPLITDDIVEQTIDYMSVILEK